MKSNPSSGIASRTLIILAVVVLVMIVIIYWVTKLALAPKPQPASTNPATIEPAAPVYEAQIGDYDFTLVSAINYGSVLPASISRSPQTQSSLITTERFIKVVIGAKNNGKNSTNQYTWDVGNVIDSDGRNFMPITERAYAWIPQPDKCGSILYPAFDATSCVRFYEISKASKALQIEVLAPMPNSSKMQKQVLDILLK